MTAHTQAVPIYDGLGVPDEPYRFLAPPSGAAKTAPATKANGTTRVTAGRSVNGIIIQTAEQGPQFSLFIPPQALAALGGPIGIHAAPLAPVEQPTGATIDGNVYDLTISDNAGPVTLTEQADTAALRLRATTARQPGPRMEYRLSASAPWQELKTSRAGQDIYGSSLQGAGQYALAFAPSAKTKKGSGSSTLLLVGGGLVLLVGIVVVIRVRAQPTAG